MGNDHRHWVVMNRQTFLRQDCGGSLHTMYSETTSLFTAHKQAGGPLQLKGGLK